MKLSAHRLSRCWAGESLFVAVAVAVALAESGYTVIFRALKDDDILVPKGVLGSSFV